MFPLVESIRTSGDNGTAIEKTETVKAAYDQLAGELARQVAITNSVASLSN